MNAITKKLIKGVRGYSDDVAADALVALWYISTRWHSGMFDPLYTVAHLTGFNPGHTEFDDEDSARSIYEEMEHYAANHRDEVDWVVITKFFNREFNKKEY